MLKECSTGGTTLSLKEIAGGNSKTLKIVYFTVQTRREILFRTVHPLRYAASLPNLPHTVIDHIIVRIIMRGIDFVLLVRVERIIVTSSVNQDLLSIMRRCGFMRSQQISFIFTHRQSGLAWLFDIGEFGHLNDFVIKRACKVGVKLP